MVTGETRKMYGKTEVDIPIQLVLLKPPVEDSRFLETNEMSVEKLFPLDSNVVAITGFINFFFC